MRIAQQEAERVLNLIRIGAAADIQEVCRTAAREFDDVHGGHCEARAVHHAGNGAVELHVIQPEFRCFQRIFFRQITQFEQIFMPEHCIVIQVDLGVEREHLAVFGQDKRVDFGERGIDAFTRFDQRNHGSRRRVDAGRRDADRKSQLACLPPGQAITGLDRFFQNCFRVVLGHFFNIHAARCRGHEDQLAGHAIEHHAQVQFAIDGERFLH